MAVKSKKKRPVKAKTNAKYYSADPNSPQSIKIDYAKVRELAGRGLTREQVASCLGIGRTTFYTRLNSDEQFAQAWQEGRDAGISAVAAALLKNVSLGSVEAQKFYLKTQANWKETERHELTGKDGGAIQTRDVGAIDQAGRERIVGLLAKALAGGTGGNSGNNPPVDGA